MRSCFILILLCHGLNAFSLKEVEDKVLDSNFQIKTAKEFLQIAQYAKSSEIGNYLPKIDLTSQGFRSQEPLTRLGLKHNVFLTNVSMTQPLFAPALLGKIKLASLEIDERSYTLEATKNDLLFLARTLFLQIALYHQKQQSWQHHMELLEQLAQKVEKKCALGEATSYQVNQAKVAIANATALYYQITSQLHNARDELAKTLGFDPNGHVPSLTIEDVDPMTIPQLAKKISQALSICEKPTSFLQENEIIETIFSQKELEEWCDRGQSTHVDVRLSRLSIQKAQQQASLCKTAYLPTIALACNFGGMPTPFFGSPSGTFTHQNFKWGVGISFNWNLFDGFKKHHENNKSKAQIKAAQYNAQEVAHIVSMRIRQQFYTLKESLGQYISAMAAFHLAEESLTQIQHQLDLGLITIYEYMTCLDQLLQTQTNIHESKFAMLSSYYGLIHATGNKHNKELP